MTTTHSRFEVGFDDIGIDSFHNDKATAFRVASRLAQQNPKLTAYVFDRMAHKGAPQLWHVVNGDLRVQERKELP